MTTEPVGTSPRDISRDLLGQSAVITGSSSGIGRAIALRLAAAGADCLIHARHRADAAAEVARQVRALGRQCEVVLADLSEPVGRDALLAAAFQWRPNLDIWINNAGADVLTGPATDWSFSKKFEALWSVDVLATIHLARAAGERMQKSGGQISGVILNMGWDQANRGMAGDSGQMFAAAKGAVMAFSRSLAQSLAPRVRVNCLAPGWIRTAWAEQASQDWQSRAIAESLMARWGTPDDVAAAAHFLVSPAASFITDQVIFVNGGRRTGRGPAS